MIVKFFSARSKAKKYASGGDGAKNYLLGDDYENNKEPTREFAKYLAGDVDNVTEIINSLDFSVPYVSGCLSFDWDESERVTEPMKQDLMQKLEETLFPNMTDRVAGYWVEHYDKLENEDDPNSRRRLELNFVFASVDLVTNKFLPIYYHAADVSRVNNYRDIANYEYDLSDPNDPKKQVSTRIPKSNPAIVRDLKSEIDKDILQGVMAGVLNNRDDIANALQDKGFEILKQKPSSISIKSPDPEAKRNIRLEGAFFAEDFDGAKWLATYQAPIIEHDSAEYERVKTERAPEIEEKRLALEVQMQKRSEFLSKRFQVPEPMATDNSILPEIKSERVQEYERNFRSALASISATRDSIFVKRNTSERILESAGTVKQYTDGTKRLVEGIDRTIENCTQFTSKLDEADNIYRHEFQQDFERTQSGIAESERILGNSKSITDTIRDRAMSIDIDRSNKLLSRGDGQSKTINRGNELRERKISKSVDRLSLITPFDPPKPMPAAGVDKPKPPAPMPAVAPPRPAPKPIPPFVSLSDLMHLNMSIIVAYQPVEGYGKDQTKTGINTFLQCVQTLDSIESGKYKKPVPQGRYSNFDSGAIVPKEILSVAPEKVIATRNLNESEKLVLQNIENQLKGSDSMALLKDIALMPVAELATKYPALGVDVAMLNVNEIRPRSNVALPPPEPVSIAEMLDHDQYQQFAEDTIKAFSRTFRSEESKQKFRQDMAKDRPVPEPQLEKADIARFDFEQVEPPAEVPVQTAEVERVTPALAPRPRPRGP